MQSKVREDLIRVLNLDPKLIRCALMGESGVDIKDVSDQLPISIECKNVEKLNIHSALKQAEENCESGKKPCVVFKRNNSSTYAVVPWSYLLDLLKGVQNGSECIDRTRNAETSPVNGV